MNEPAMIGAGFAIGLGAALALALALARGEPPPSPPPRSEPSPSALEIRLARDIEEQQIRNQLAQALRIAGWPPAIHNGGKRHE